MKNKNPRREYQRKWRQAHPDYQRNWRKKHPDYVASYSRLWNKKYPNYYRDRAEREVPSSTELVLTHYGKGKLACIRCGYTDTRALTLDHINGDGAKQRFQDRVAHKGTKGGKALYRFLLKEDLPEGYQTLCMNCQFIKRVENNEVRKYTPE